MAKLIVVPREKVRTALRKLDKLPVNDPHSKEIEKELRKFKRKGLTVRRAAKKRKGVQ